MEKSKTPITDALKLELIDAAHSRIREYPKDEWLENVCKIADKALNALSSKELELAEEKAMRAKNIWCCEQAENECKTLKRELAAAEQRRIADLRKCEEIASKAYVEGVDPAEDIRAAFPEINEPAQERMCPVSFPYPPHDSCDGTPAPAAGPDSSINVHVVVSCDFAQDEAQQEIMRKITWLFDDLQKLVGCPLAVHVNTSRSAFRMALRRSGRGDGYSKTVYEILLYLYCIARR